MTPLAWLIGLFLPACGAPGAQGLPPPAPLNFAHLQRPASPNSALAGPAGSQPPPDIVTPVYPVAAHRLYDAVRSVAAHQPRTYPAAEYPERLQVHFVARSAVFNFPDLITVQVNQASSTGSTLLLYSRSRYGHSDLGVNRQRLATWLAAVQTTINHP